MTSHFRALDRIAAALATTVLRRRAVVIAVALLTAALFGSGAARLEFSTNYRVFFSAANPELQAFEDLQATYTKNDNFLFVLRPAGKNAFDARTLAAVEALTEGAWQIPFAIRVDSISNFQHSYAVGDELVVEDLVSNAATRSDDWLDDRRRTALAEPLLNGQLLTADAAVTGVNVVLQYPEQGLMEVPEAVDVARALKADIATRYPDIDVHLTGVSMLNNAFAETGMHDGATLMPLMFGVIFVLTWLLLRSFSATVATLVVIAVSTTIAMGLAGLAGVKLTPIAMSAPIVILTLAVADSVHILMSLRAAMRDGQDKTSALVEALRVNFLPVSITSLTTIIGFLALNFSDSPPYWHFGNIAAVGIAAAWLLSLTLLPALVSLLPMRQVSATGPGILQTGLDRLAEFVIRRPRELFAGIGVVVVAIIALIPTLRFNDQWVEYFDERIEFRTDSDAVQEYFGLYPIEYSVPAAGPGGISEPEYLQHLERLTEFLKAQPNVTHVYSISDIMKRLNRNMHADDPQHYRIPDDRDLSAQYLLLYELSLPYGLDLNDRINVDKSASRVTATLARGTTAETKAFFATVDEWMRANLPEYMQARPTSAAVMFTYISERNLQSMIAGTVIAVLAIALIMVMALRSLRLGLLSLVPNGLPILVTFGTWAMLVGDVGFSIATVASISLGIVVDDTVHLLSKYVRARDEQGLSVEDAIRYAFRHVGAAIVVNTVILTAGFLVMTASAFKMNVDLGLMTILSIVGALLLDFLFLPALLLLGQRRERLHGATPAATADWQPAP